MFLNKFPSNGLEVFIIFPLSWICTIAVSTEYMLVTNGNDFNSMSPTGEVV